MLMYHSWKSTRNFSVWSTSLVIKQSYLKLTTDLLLPSTTIHGNISNWGIHSGAYHYIKNWYHEGERWLLGSGYSITFHIPHSEVRLRYTAFVELPQTELTLTGCHYTAILGGFANRRKMTIRLMSVRPPACPHETTQLSTDRFACNLILGVFRKSVEKIQVSLKSDKNNSYFV